MLLQFAKGGFQEARGSGGVGDYYFENVMEELDSPAEWFHSLNSSTLFFIPPTPAGAQPGTQQPPPAVVYVDQMPRVLQFRGDADDPVHHLTLRGFNVTHASPTYLESYEAPSGGDWSIHRGGAVFVEGAANVTLDGLRFDQCDGNALFLSNAVRDCVVKDCDFWRTGDSAIAVVGSTRLMDGTANSFPAHNTFETNWIDTVGVNTKQVSCFMKAVTHANTVVGNVCYDGPRAGFNWNDQVCVEDMCGGYSCQPTHTHTHANTMPTGGAHH